MFSLLALENEYRAAPDALVKGRLEFTVTELIYTGSAQPGTKTFGDFLGQVSGCPAREEFNGRCPVHNEGKSKYIFCVGPDTVHKNLMRTIC